MSAFPALSLPGGCGCCDCVIRTADGGEFRAHRAFLCATSPFFRAAFCTEYGSRRDLLLEDVPAEALGVLLSFYYLDEPGITSDNVAEVLEAADMLLMDEVRDLCLDHLLRNMDTDNCLGLAALAQRYHCPRFKDAIFCFVRENFDAVWRSSDEFPETAASLLAELFASDELNVRDEVDLLHATERWSLGGVATSPEGQDADLSRLLNCVRVGLCSQSALENFRELRSSLALSGAYHVAVCEAVQKGPCLCSPSPLLLMQLATLTPDAYHSLPCPHTSGSDTSLNDVTMAEETTSAATEAVAQPHCKHCGGSSPERWLPRMPYEMLFVVGGWSAGEEREAVETYDPRAKRWLMQPVEGLLPRAYHGVALLRKKIYVVGGMRAQEYLRSCDCFDTESGTWESCSPMQIARGYVAVVALGDYMYAIGGRNETERTATVERYNPRTNQWIYVAAMLRRRSEGAACAFRGKLYISGGFSGEKVLVSVEEYTPYRNSWCTVRQLPGPRCSHQMVQLAGRIYVIGGYDGRQRVDTVFASSEGEAPFSWCSVAPMRTRRSTFAVALLDGELYVIGGFDGLTTTADVERYSPATNTWHDVVPLNEPVSAMSACCVRGLAVARRLSSRGAFGSSS